MKLTSYINATSLKVPKIVTDLSNLSAFISNGDKAVQDLNLTLGPLRTKIWGRSIEIEEQLNDDGCVICQSNGITLHPDANHYQSTNQPPYTCICQDGAHVGSASALPEGRHPLRLLPYFYSCLISLTWPNQLRRQRHALCHPSKTLVTGSNLSPYSSHFDTLLSTILNNIIKLLLSLSNLQPTLSVFFQHFQTSILEVSATHKPHLPIWQRF